MGRQIEVNDEGSVRNQYVAAFVTALLAYVHGCTIGWTSPTLPLLLSEDTPLAAPLTKSETSLIGSLICLGGCLATPIFGWSSDRFGRKVTVLVSSAPYVAAWALKLSYRTAAGVMAARFLAGVGGGGVFVVTATYLVEIASVRTRGLLGSLMIFFLNAGIVSAYAMGAYLGYDAVLGIMLALPVVFFALMTRMPETPVFLVKNNRDREAAKAIAWLRSVPEDSVVVQREMEALKFDIELTRTHNVEEIRDEKVAARQNSSWRYLFLVRPTLKAFAVCFTLMSVQSFLGIFAVITYANWIFQQAGSTMSANVSSIIVGCIQFFGSVVASSLIERAGRKVLLFASCGINALCMFAIGTYFYLSEIGEDVSNIGWIPVTALSLAVSTFAMGIGPIPYILPSEIIPVQARGLGNVIALVWVWLAAFLIGQFFQPVVDILGMYGVFWCFSVSGCVGIVVTLLCLPETKGKPFEEIIAFYGGNGKHTEKAEQLL